MAALGLVLLAESQPEWVFDSGGAAVLFLVFLGAAVYFFPLVVAIMRSHHNAASIAVINIFLGWTFLGWVIALAMAFSAVQRPRRRYVD